ncbi:MAG: PIN domain-containing protein [Thermoplasmataceae archaeon]
MNRLDTSIIIILLDGSDHRFPGADGIVVNEGTIISDLGLVELTSSLGRNNIENPLAYVIHIIKKFRINLLSSVDSSFVPGFGRINTLFYNSLNLTEKLKLRTLDLIHVSYCIYLKDNNYDIVNLFKTDKEFIISKELLHEHKIDLKIIQ